MIHKSLPGTIIFLLATVALYVGTAALISSKEISDYEEAKKIAHLGISDTVEVIYDGLAFKNVAEMNHYIADVKYSNISRWFDWSNNFPDFLIVILGTCSFGLIGAVMKILYEHIFSIKQIANSNFIALPLLGGLSGFISIGVSYILPNFFLDTKSMVNPVGLIFFSLFFGFFIKEFFDKISNQMFNKKE